MNFSRLVLLFLFLSSFHIFLNGMSAASPRNVEQIISYINGGYDFTALELTGIENLKLPVRIIDLLRSIKIKDSHIESYNDVVKVFTNAKIGWTELPVVISMKPSTYGFIDSTILIEVPDGWKVSSLLPALSRLDILCCDNMNIFVSNYEYFDEQHDIFIEKGANLFGDLSFGGPLQYAKFFIGDYLDKIKISGLIKQEIVGSTFRTRLPGTIDFIGGFSATDLELEVSIGDTVSSEELCIINANVFFSWPSQDKLEFKTSIGVYPDKLELYGSMDGKIKNIFGIHGVHAGSWFFGGTVDSSDSGILTDFIPFSSFTMGFDLEFVGRKVKMASKIGVPGISDLGDLAFEGKLEETLTINECVNFVGNIIEETPYFSEGVKEFENRIEGCVPNFTLNEVYIFFSPKDVFMGGVIYNKGLIVDGRAEIFGSDAQIFIDVQESGMRILGYLEEMEFGPIKITGPGYDRVMDTPDDGMIMDAVLMIDQQYCYIASEVQIDILGGISSKTDIDISSSGISFSTEKKLLDLFDFGLFFTSEFNEYFIPVDFYVEGYMRQTALLELQNLLSKTARRMSKTKVLMWEQDKKGFYDFVETVYDGFWNVLAGLVGNTFNIKEFKFESSVDELVGQTILPKVTIKGIVLGKEFELKNVSFDMSNPIISAREIIEQISQLFV